jgi:hypothetical protein
MAARQPEERRPVEMAPHQVPDPHDDVRVGVDSGREKEEFELWATALADVPAGQPWTPDAARAPERVTL